MNHIVCRGKKIPSHIFSSRDHWDKTWFWSGARICRTWKAVLKQQIADSLNSLQNIENNIWFIINKFSGKSRIICRRTFLIGMAGVGRPFHEFSFCRRTSSSAWTGSRLLVFTKKICEILGPFLLLYMLRQDLKIPGDSSVVSTPLREEWSLPSYDSPSYIIKKKYSHRNVEKSKLIDLPPGSNLL